MRHFELYRTVGTARSRRGSSPIQHNEFRGSIYPLLREGMLKARKAEVEAIRMAPQTDETGSPDDDPKMKDLVFGESQWGDNLIILPRSVAEQLKELNAALSSATWGELRRDATAEIYAEILGQAGYGDLDEFLSHLDIGKPVPGARTEALRKYAEKHGDPLPEDDDPFDADRDLGSYADWDFPPAPQLLMLQYLPDDVIEKFGNVYDTNFNGTFVDFEKDQLADIIAALEKDGFSCTEDQTLIDEAQRS